jgi:hypothetical protein
VYSEKQGKKELGFIDVTKLSHVEHGTEGKHHVLKMSLCGGRSYVLSGDMSADIDEWVSVLSSPHEGGTDSAAEPPPESTPSSAFPPGHKPSFEDYAIISKIGKGSFGIVQSVR